MFFNAFDERARELFNEDKEKYLVLSWIIFKTNYQGEYSGLKKGECYISTSILSNEFNIDRMRVSRVLKDLETQGFIAWIYRSNSRHKPSIISLKSVTVNVTVDDTVNVTVETSNTSDLECIDVTVDDTVNVTSSKNISKNISIYSDSDIKKLINSYPGKKVKAIRDKKLPKILKENGIDQTKRCVERYASECKGKDKQYILNESTFWNGRYMDYLDCNYENNTKEDNTENRGNIYPNTNFDYD